MEYRFSLTPRLIALSAAGLLALLVLLFSLGYQLGLRMQPNPKALPAPVLAVPALTAVPEIPVLQPAAAPAASGTPVAPAASKP